MNKHIVQRVKSEFDRLLFILLVLIITLCGISIQSSGKLKNDRIKKEQEYQLAEKIYRDELREFLNQTGYHDSGINMTSIITTSEDANNKEEVEEVREYDVSIHHKKITQLNSFEISELLTRIVGIEVPMNDCKVSIKFIK